MNKNAWDHLPNAKQIDRVLASVKANPKKWADAWDKIPTNATYYAAWNAARDAMWNAERSPAWNAAWNAALDAMWNAERSPAWNAALDAVWNAVRDAIMALIVYDTCGYMLNETLEAVEILAALGVDGAILLLPAVKVMSMA